MARKVQSIYTYFNEYTKENIDEIIDELSEKEHQSLRRRYGNDLNNPNPPEDYTKEEKDYFYASLIPKIRRHLRKKFKTQNSNKNSGQKRNRKITSLYEALSDYPKEEIDKLVDALPDNQKEIIRIRFGSDLENPKEERKLTPNEILILHNTIIRKLERQLSKRIPNGLKKDKKDVQEGTIESSEELKQVQTTQESVEQEKTPQREVPEPIEPQKQIQPEIASQNEESNINSLTTKDGLKEMLEILTKPSFTTLLEVMTPKEAIIFCLRLGAGGKRFKANDIAEFLGIDVQDVYDTTNKALDTFQDNVDMLLAKEQEKTEELKLTLKK